MFWATHTVPGERAARVVTWDPVSGEVQEAFALETSYGGGSRPFGLAHDAVTDTLWLIIDRGSLTVARSTTDGRLVSDHAVDQRVVRRGLDFDGVYLWLGVEVDDLRTYPRFLPPAPGEPWPAPSGDLGRVWYNLAFADASFDRSWGSPRCVLWDNQYTGWEFALQAFEAPCPVASVADAWSLDGDLLDAGPVSAVHAEVPEPTRHGRVLVRDHGTASEEAVTLAAGPVVASGAHTAVGADVARVERLFAASAQAASRLAALDVAGLVRADALEVRAHAVLQDGRAEVVLTGTVIGLRIGDAAPVDVPFEGEPVTLPLPGGVGTVTLFEVWRQGDGTSWAEARITALRVDLTGADAPAAGPRHLEAAVAWTGVAAGGHLASHPPAVSPPVAPCLDPAAGVEADCGLQAIRGPWVPR